MNKEILFNYLTQEGLRDFHVDGLLRRFARHPEIAYELEERISGKEPKSPVRIEVFGETFSARSLMETHSALDKLYKAYNYLIFLKEDPEYAFAMLKMGLPLED